MVYVWLQFDYVIDNIFLQYSSYQHYLKMLIKTEKEVDEHSKELATCYSKVTKAKKQVCIYAST